MHQYVYQCINKFVSDSEGTNFIALDFINFHYYAYISRLSEKLKNH